MILKRIGYLAGIGLCAAILLGNTHCQSNTNGGIGPEGPNFVTTLAVEDANGNITGSFSSGQQIQFVLSVRNRSSSSQTIPFNTAQQVNFAVLDSGSATEVWTWSLSQTFAQSTSSLTLAAGQTRTFTVLWSQTSDSGQLVAGGNYEALGGVTCNYSSSSSNSSVSTTCMPSGAPTSSDLVPSVYISTLVPFNIQ